MTLPASRQSKQNVAATTHATTYTASKPPARPAPPSVGIVPSTSTTTTTTITTTLVVVLLKDLHHPQISEQISHPLSVVHHQNQHHLIS